MKSKYPLFTSILLQLIIPIFAQNDISSNQQQEGIKIGSERQLFVDHYLIDTLDQAELRLHSPRDEGPVLFFDKAWEGPFSGYCTIIKDRMSLFRAYYRGLPTSGQDGSNNEVSCYAESDDGINMAENHL